jgi:hypothetical protein
MIPETDGSWVGEGDINDLGQVTGKGPGGVPFRWSAADGLEVPDLPPGASGIGLGINNYGDVVGHYRLENAPGPINHPVDRPFIWTEAGLVDLSPTPLQQGGTEAYAVNEAGVVVGY